MSIFSAPKNVERMSPISVDSGFDSSFPPSPDSSSNSSNSSVALPDRLKCLLSGIPSPRSTSLTSSLSSSKPSTKLDELHPPPSCLSPSPSVSSTSSSSFTSSPTHSFASSLSPSTFTHIDAPSSSTPKNENNENMEISGVGEPLTIICDATVEKSDESHSDLLQIASLSEANTTVHHCSSKPSTSHSAGPAYDSIDYFSSSSIGSPSCTASTSSTSEPSELYVSPSAFCQSQAPRSSTRPLRCRCFWDQCQSRSKCENDLYDHVIKEHIERLCVADVLSPKGKGRFSPRIRTRSIECRWGDCEMRMSRGNPEKQVAWLKDHYTTRHAGKAQPFRCLIDGCNHRFTLKRSLEDHLRCGHEKAKVKRHHHENTEILKPRTGFRVMPILFFPPSGDTDAIDRSTEEWLVKMLRKSERMISAGLCRQLSHSSCIGAAHRKCRNLLRLDIVPIGTPEDLPIASTYRN
ncbi:hypothetical protein AB6A40_001576 [Gnathostoma spinigerum]|uniref:C2H2-type domain-containing protein n=1 Tax=Gnathostoma spinigerum TaxID=75299 RepID=A0ABD6EDU7_9BILA